ncbi:glycoside hydrolase [Lonsdalea populi]|nr:glycoside hydrolase [Lonsdalea populi]RAT67281.1 glycoside hydrolase [Lonsdalea populi]RAT68703.1 glycoside hydrolase [Lonsdalea populi]RAT72365.1 glycoside hydrolase [Lonsdalea populi]
MFMKKTLGFASFAMVALLANGNTLAASTSKDGAKLYLPGGIDYVYNNTWGKSDVPNGQQAIYLNSAKDMGWSWSWINDINSVKGYPSIVHGWHWTKGYGTNTGLPIRLSENKNINTSAAWSFSNTSGTYNVSYDIWFHSDNKASWSSAPTDELMIWMNSTNASPAGSYVNTVTIGGIPWDVYKGKVSSWNVYSFVIKSNQTSANLNIKNFTDYLVNSKRWMSNTKYISSIEFGTELYKGSGTFKISKWSISIK